MSNKPEERKPYGQHPGDVTVNTDGHPSMGLGSGLGIDLTTGGLDINVGGVSIALDGGA